MKDRLSDADLERLHDLAGALREDRITDEEVAELDQMLSESPAAVDAWVEMSSLAAELRHFHGRIQAKTAKPAPRAPSRMLLTLAAMLVLAGALSIWGVRWMTSLPGDVVATLSRAEGDAELLRNGSQLDLADGQPMHAADYELLSGILEVTYAAGPVCIIEAPAAFRLESTELLNLYTGQLSANVPEAASGFTVLTHGTRVVDLGTEFAISAAEDASEIHVFEGEVRIEPEDDPEVVLLTSNDASRITHDSQTPAGIDLNPDRFLRHLEEPDSPWSENLAAMNPVAWYRLGVSRGLRLEDEAGDLNGHIVPGLVDRTHFAPGKFGGSFLVQGPVGRGYGVVPDYPVAMEDQLSVSAWVFAESRPRWASIAKNWPFGSPKGNGQFHFGLWNDDGDLEVHVNNRAGEEIGVRENMPLPLGEWHHVAFVMDGAELRLYRNGKMVDSIACEGLSTTAPPQLGIGVKLDENGDAIEGGQAGFWHGRIDELALFHRALTEEDIRDLSRSAL